MENIKKINKELEKLGKGGRDEIMSGFYTEFRNKLSSLLSKLSNSFYKMFSDEELRDLQFDIEEETMKELQEIVRDEIETRGIV